MAEQNKSGGSSGSRSRSTSNRSRSRSRGSSNGRSPSQKSASQAQAQGQNGSGEPDVLLDVPQLKVDEIGLEVENLHARIALETRLGDLLHLHVGADVVIDKVALEIKGVDAQAQLKARLENVFAILDRTLQTVDENPEILAELAKNSERVQAALTSGEGDD
jgi:hypothetical protein